MKQLKSIIVHDDVSFIEIRRGEGIEGGDTLVIGVEHPGANGAHESYYFLPPSALRLNRYRFRFGIIDVKLLVDNDLGPIGAKDSEELSEELLEKLKTEGKVALPLLGNRYPTVIVEAVYAEKGVNITVRVRKPRGEPVE